MIYRACCLSFSLFACVVGCQGVGGATQSPITAPTTAPAPFVCSKFDFSIQPPADWSQTKGASDTPLALVPRSKANAKDLSLVPSLKVQVPDLPPHIPGMIPVGSVADGYVNDLRKHYPDLHVDERVVLPIPNGSARRIVCTLRHGQTTWRDIALCIVHKDRVFLIVAECSAGDYPATRAAFDAMAGSLKWN